MLKVSRSIRVFRLYALNVTLAALALLAFVAPVEAAPGDNPRVPDLVGDCQRLQVQSGNTLFLYAFGVGVQIYCWSGSSWDFVAPEAVLYADAGDHGVVATHFGGPTWESNSGSRVVGTVIDRCTPDPDSIPWLLLGAASAEGPGLFGRVTFIQRLNTVGGKAPAVPGDFRGQVARVPYTADYLFYH